MADLELSDSARDALGTAALHWVLQYFREASDAPVYPRASASELHHRVAQPLPRVGSDPADVLAEFAALAALGRKNGHPRMFGYVQSSGNFAGTIADFLASALNQNVTSWRSAPSATTIELQVIEWIKQFIGCETMAGGVLVSGGSAANLVAIATALRASTNVDINARGVTALPGQPAIYASERVHMSIPKAAALVGLGRDAMRIVPTNGAGEMEPALLAEMIDADRAAGRHVVAVVANAGDVNTGAIDPVDAIADVCAPRGIWLHVDGSYGGFAAAVPRMRAAFHGLSRAHSLSLDPHKWLFTPLDAGCLLVRDVAHLRRAFAQSAAYVDVVADPDMSDFAFWDISPELSRRFRALKIWFALKIHGADAFVSTIDRNIECAQGLGALLDEHGDFERLAAVPLSIVCFRYRPESMVEEPALNAFNRDLMVEVQRDGDTYLSNALLDGRFALRACIVNHRTTHDDVRRVITTVRRLAALRLRL